METNKINSNYIKNYQYDVKYLVIYYSAEKIQFLGVFEN